MPSLVSWLVAGLAVADRAASLSYTLSKTYDASNFLDEFEFQTSPIDRDPYYSPFMNYQNKADALDKGLVSVQNGKIYLGVDSKNELPDVEDRATVRVQSKNSFKQGLVITRFSHLPEPVCGGSPFFGTRGTGQYPDIGINMYEGWDLYPVKKVGISSSGTEECVEDQYDRTPYSGYDCSLGIFSGRDHFLHQFCQFEQIQNKIWGSPEGGIQALEWTSDAIKLYNWPINAAPSNIESSNPDTSSWGTPSAQFTKPSCDTQETFSNQTLEFSPDFCGSETLWWEDYADGKYGPTCRVITGEESCESHVAKKPQAFKNYYFEVENIRIFDQAIENTQGQLLLDGSGPSLTFDYATTSQPSSDNWIGVWPEDDTQAPRWGSVAWEYVAQSSGSIRIPPPSSMKAGKYKAYLLSGDRTVLASLPSFDYSPTSNTQGQLSLDGNGPLLTLDYATSQQPSSDNWIGIWPEDDTRAPTWGSTTWDYAKEDSGSLQLTPPSSMKAGKYKAYLLSGDRTILAFLPSFDYSPSSDSVAFSVKTHYKTKCADGVDACSVDNNVDIKPGNGVCVNTNCGVSSLEILSVGSCPDGQVRISYWQNADCAGDWYGYGYGSRDTCHGLWSNGWGFKSLWLSCAEPNSDCVKQGTCIADPEPSIEICRATADAGTTDAFHLKTRYSTGCTGAVYNEVTVPHGNGQCIDTNCAVGSLDIDNVGNCPDGELRISYWEQSGCSGKWFGYGYGSRNTCRTLWSAGLSFKSLWVSCAKQSDDCISRGTCFIDEVPSRPVCS
ncbi:hypothetical protein MY8738_004819 [Beauveria namnaoensis]